MPSGVYWIYQPALDRAVYVGSSQNIARRWREHISRLRKGTAPNPKLQNTWRKYGANAFEFTVLEDCPIEKLVEREEFWMLALAPTCNLADAADAPMRGRTASAETRQKLSAAMKGKPKSAEHRRKIGEAQRGKFVKSPSEEQRQVVSAKLKGKLPWNTGITMSDEQKHGMSERMKGNKNLLGHVHSEETRRKMSEAHKGKKRNRKEGI